MKSSDSQLKSRGMITVDDIQQYNSHTQVELLGMLKSKEAYKRTIAVKLLSEKYDLNDDMIRLFLHTLKQENKIYTKIELCDAFSKGDVQSAKIMVNKISGKGEMKNDSKFNRVGLQAKYN